MNTLHPNLDSDSAYRLKSQTPLPPTKQEGKGKSNLMLAISTFGYQILQYPHFAELCWVTSKLKEGPSAEIDGPRKVWPFNSCIVRPSNAKSKEKYGLVHGLIAVGLSAYRGLYSSLRDVSADVRKVLEILTSQINAKVESGKDRYQFVRLLSQVAYLDDMVNSWTYTLQSLEAPSQPVEAITQVDVNAPQVDENTFVLVDENALVQVDENAPIQVDENTPVQVDDCTDKPSHSESVKESTEHVAIVDEPNRLLQTQGSSSFKDQTDNLLESEPNGIILERSEPKSMVHSNGFMSEESSVPADQVLRSSSSGVCLYRFCSKCLSNLKSAMQRLVISQWDVKSSNWTTEDVDDGVTSLSLNLSTTVREFCLSDNIRVVNVKFLETEEWNVVVIQQATAAVQLDMELYLN